MMSYVDLWSVSVASPGLYPLLLYRFEKKCYIIIQCLQRIYGNSFEHNTAYAGLQIKRVIKISMLLFVYQSICIDTQKNSLNEVCS